jgi:hypothetical protein
MLYPARTNPDTDQERAMEIVCYVKLSSNSLLLNVQDVEKWFIVINGGKVILADLDSLLISHRHPTSKLWLATLVNQRRRLHLR